jgi:hypothetical protein
MAALMDFNAAFDVDMIWQIVPNKHSCTKKAGGSANVVDVGCLVQAEDLVASSDYSYLA